MSLLLREAIGGTIRRARTARRRTLRDVSQEARVSLGYLSEIERGRKEPSSELLAAICEALALPLPELLDEVADALRPARRPLHPVPAADPAIDDALRTAVEEAFEPVGEDRTSASGSASGSTSGSTSGTAPASASAGPAGPAPSAAPAAARVPAPPEPTDPAPPRTVALPEPEGLPGVDEGEEVVAPVEAGTPVRLVGLVTVPATPGAGRAPRARAAA